MTGRKSSWWTLAALVLLCAAVAFYGFTRRGRVPSSPDGDIMMIKTNQQSEVESAGPDSKQAKQATTKETPFACNMLALNPDERRRHIQVIEELKGRTRGIEELPDGYAFRFEPEQANITLVSEFVLRERLCCPFFTFEQVAEAEGGTVRLRLRGRKGVKEFIREEFRLDKS